VIVYSICTAYDGLPGGMLNGVQAVKMMLVSWQQAQILFTGL
jgi:hypothetical protein